MFDDDEEDEEIVECPECDGTGVGEEDRYDLSIPVNHNGSQEKQDCPICCGFGRLDW